MITSFMEMLELPNFGHAWLRVHFRVDLQVMALVMLVTIDSQVLALVLSITVDYYYYYYYYYYLLLLTFISC